MFILHFPLHLPTKINNIVVHPLLRLAHANNWSYTKILFYSPFKCTWKTYGATWATQSKHCSKGLLSFWKHLFIQSKHVKLAVLHTSIQKKTNYDIIWIGNISVVPHPLRLTMNISAGLWKLNVRHLSDCKTSTPKANLSLSKSSNSTYWKYLLISVHVSH